MREQIHSCADSLEKSAVELSTKHAVAFLKNWIDYKPHQDVLEVVGIDSSFNRPAISGFNIGAVSCVAENSQREEYYAAHKIIRQHDLSEVSRELEATAIRNIANRDDVTLLLVDGSIFSFLTNGNLSQMLEPVIDKLRRHKVLFVSKTSNAKSDLTKDLPCADIFYWNRLTATTGFSVPLVDTSFGTNKQIISTYVRLEEHSPVLKMEMLATNDTTEMRNDPTMEICKALDKMAGICLDGYPAPLRHAHEDVKISSEDIDEAETIWGFSHFMGSREPLN